MRHEIRKEEGWFDNDNMGTGGLVWLLREVSIEASRVLIDGGWMFVFCDWRMMPILQPAIESGGLRFRALLVWDKGSGGMGTAFRPQHELILAMCTGTARCFDTTITNVLKGKRVHPTKRAHPTEKPTDVLAKLIQVSTEPGDLVVDCFMGAGSTGIAAVSMGRKFIGCDWSPEYLAKAHERISAVAMGRPVVADQSRFEPQPTLFGQVQTPAGE